MCTYTPLRPRTYISRGSIIITPRVGPPGYPSLAVGPRTPAASRRDAMQHKDMPDRFIVGRGLMSRSHSRGRYGRIVVEPSPRLPAPGRCSVIMPRGPGPGHPDDIILSETPWRSRCYGYLRIVAAGVGFCLYPAARSRTIVTIVTYPITRIQKPTIVTI